MCNKFSIPKSSLTPTAVKLAKLTVVLIFFCFAECAAGSCISYGHSCWGAHGKRSGEIIPNDLPADMRWFLSRLLSGSRNNKEQILTFPPNVDKQIFKDVTEGKESSNSLEDMDLPDLQDSMVPIDALFPDGSSVHSRISADKMQFLKFLKNNAGRNN